MFDWALLIPETDFWGFKTNWANLKPIFFTLEGFLCDHRDLSFHIRVSRARLKGYFNVRLSIFHILAHLPETDFWGFKINWANLKPNFFTFLGFLGDHSVLIFHIRVSRARLVGFFNVRLSTFATWNWLLRLQNQLGQPKTYFFDLGGVPMWP